MTQTKSSVLPSSFSDSRQGTPLARGEFKPASSEWGVSLWDTAVSYNFPAALWRLPRSTEKHFIAQNTPQVARVKADLEELPQGFLISPFHNPDLAQTYFIRADLHFSSEKAWIKEADEATMQAFLHQANEAKQKRNLPTFSPQDTILPDTENHYKELVANGIEAIKRGDFQKVVLSRQKEIALPTHFNAMHLFDQLCEAYPHAFISLFSIPLVGVWLSATPELLISTDNNQIFRTVALAGTQALNPAEGVAKTSWTHKDIIEQAMVSRYIVECFKKIRLREYTETGPRTVTAGNLLHLRTDFEVDMKATNFPQLGTVMLELLHPTSAVCGMPKQPATSFISANEGYNRSFYSGFLGPIHFGGESHTFVHLRCMQLFEGKAILYAGAGITADSDPNREWQETELKCQTLGRIVAKI